MQRYTRWGVVVSLVLPLSLFLPSIASAASPTLFGDATLQSSGGNPGYFVQATSDSTPPGYGGIDFALPGGTTVNDLSTLSTDYKVLVGDCGGGAPRFSISLSSGKNIFVYLGPTPNFTGCSASWTNTGNLLSDADLRVDTTQVGGTFYDTWAHAKTLVGSDTITDLALVVDAGWKFTSTGQSFGFDNTTINSTMYDYTPTYTVTIDKFVDGHMATAAAVNSASFPMQSSWNAVNLGGAGSGTYPLGPSGFNSPNAYEAITSPMNAGSSYTTNEVTGGSVVGADCSNGQPYELLGYTTGDSLGAAEAATPSATVPNFADLQSNEYVIVWNKTCPPPSVITNSATNETMTTATLNATNGPINVNDTSFWWGTTPISGLTPGGNVAEFPATGWTHDSGLGPVSAGGTFSEGVTGLTPATKYYFVAWVEVGSTWYPGNVLSFITPRASGACPANTTQGASVDTIVVNSSTASPTTGAATLANGTSYVLSASGTWQNNSINAADAAFASLDNWVNYQEGYDLSPFFLGPQEFQLQVNGNFVNWGPYSSSHQYSYLYSGTGAPVNLGVFDGDSNFNTPNPGWYGDNVGSLTVNVYPCNPVPPPPPANACINYQAHGTIPNGYTLVTSTTKNANVTLAPQTMFVALSGNNTVSAGAGNHIICTGAGNDTITVGNGQNVINAGAGNNTVQTGDGDQTVTTLGGNDKITTGAGNDVINAGDGNNAVNSGAGNDTITTGSGNDYINAGPGTDTCNAGGGMNTKISCELP